jgi:hypothetical protein
MFGTENPSFLGISSTNIDALYPSLYLRQSLHHRNFLLLSQPLPHLRFNLFVNSEIFATFLDSDVKSFRRQTLSHRKQKIFLYEYPLHLVIFPQKRHKTPLFYCTRLKFGHHLYY